MNAKRLAIIGAVVFLLVSSFTLLLYLRTLEVLEQSAVVKDRSTASFRALSGERDPCLFPEVELTMPRRILSEDDSGALVISILNEGESDCNLTVRISAPSFQVTPLQDRQEVTVPARQSAEVSWIVAPTRIGTHSISVSAGNRTRILGVTVTNALGLTARQSQILQGIGYFFGPALTFPWLYNAWKDYRRRKEEDEQQQTAAGTDTGGDST